MHILSLLIRFKEIGVYNVNKEIERKYEMKYIPKDIKIEKIQNIEQSFIYRDINTHIRIRKIEIEQDINYIYTIKTKGDIQYDDSYQLGQKYEIESNITKELYEELLPRRISNQIRKTRIVVPIQNNLKVEMDVYKGYLEGLLTAEIEFQNEQEANKFDKPNWLGEELGYKVLSNRRLAEMTREEWQEKVTKEFIENNQKVISQLEKDYNII